MEKMESFVQRRLSERLPVDVEVKYFNGNIFYSGSIKNVSENGMYIKTRRCLPSESIFAIIIRTHNKLFNVLAKVKWLINISDQHCGMGVEILNPPLELMESICNMDQ